MFDFGFWALVLILGVVFTFWGWFGRKREAELKKHLLGKVPSVTITAQFPGPSTGTDGVTPVKTTCKKCGVEFEPAITLRVPLTAAGMLLGYSIGATLEKISIIPTLMMLIGNRYVDMIFFGVLGHQIGRKYGRCPACGAFQRL